MNLNLMQIDSTFVQSETEFDLKENFATYFHSRNPNSRVYTRKERRMDKMKVIALTPYNKRPKTKLHGAKSFVRS